MLYVCMFCIPSLKETSKIFLLLSIFFYDFKCKYKKTQILHHKNQLFNLIYILYVNNVLPFITIAAPLNILFLQTMYLCMCVIASKYHLNV